MGTASKEKLWSALHDVKDPEIPTISIVELGMVNQISWEGNQVQVEMTPTFVGCPALDIIRRDTQKRLLQLEGVAEVHVSFVIDPPWTSERITAEGRKKLPNLGSLRLGSMGVTLLRSFHPALTVVLKAEKSRICLDRLPAVPSFIVANVVSPLRE